MNVLTLIQSLATRADELETAAKALRADAHQIQSLLFGGAASVSSVQDAVEATEAVTRVKTARTPKPAAPAKGDKKKMPSRAVILEKAAEYGVDVSDILPGGKKPSDAEKQDALRRIYAVKKAQEDAAALTEEGDDDEGEASTPVLPLVSDDD